MEGNYLAPDMGVAMSQRLYPQGQQFKHVCSPLLVWQSNVPKSRVSHASSIVQTPMLNSRCPQPSFIADVAPQYTQDLLVASPL
jgi:hypothetical protein